MVEVVDEIHDPLLQSLYRREVAAMDDSTDNHAEPDLNLIQPRAVLGHIQELNAPFGGRQKCLTSLLLLQDPRLSL